MIEKTKKGNGDTIARVGGVKVEPSLRTLDCCVYLQGQGHLTAVQVDDLICALQECKRGDYGAPRMKTQYRALDAASYGSMPTPWRDNPIRIETREVPA